MNQQEKRRHLFRVFLKSKALFAGFSIVLSLLLVLGSTYAWITSADERVNRAAANQRKLSARIVEDFQPVFHWAPGTTQTKAVRVKNDGETPVIVRLSLKEFLVAFEVDTTDNHVEDILHGNANLKVYDMTSLPEENKLIAEKTDTWVVGNIYTASADDHYKATQVWSDQVYGYGATHSLPLSAFQLNFQAKVYDTPAEAAGQTDYWYYHDGYFYYSEVLKPKDTQPGETTINLLESVTLDAGYTNHYKGALYKLVPEMDAHDITESILDDWGIAGSQVEEMYKEQLYYMNKATQGGGG